MQTGGKAACGLAVLPWPRSAEGEGPGMQCPRCQHDNRPQAKFCEECAAPLARTCPNCGTQVSPEAKFCSECAHAVTGPVSTQPRYTSPETYTPKHLAEKILTQKSALEGERKQVTVLLADLKGSMELLADRDPEDARKLLDPVLERMMEAVHRYEGTVEPGDGRWDHGPLRGAGGPRGPCRAGMLCRPRVRAGRTDRIIVREDVCNEAQGVANVHPDAYVSTTRTDRPVARPSASVHEEGARRDGRRDPVPRTPRLLTPFLFNPSPGDSCEGRRDDAPLS